MSRRTTRLNLESFEARDLPTASPLPVLLVIADQQDFYYKEYNDTRNSLLAQNVPVVVAARTTAPSTPHAGSGQGTGSGVVTPNIALGNANASDYSAIAFVGGWGASMYQYAFNDPDFNGINNNFYYNGFYNGDTNLNDGVTAPQKIAANNLINDFLDQDKPVAGVCHGVTVLAWARVNGVSPIAGKTVAVPLTDGTPGMFYNSANYSGGYSLGQYDQALANGAIASKVSGQYGNPTTAADDVLVDGRIITAENQHSAAYFGTVIAQQVIALANPTVVSTSVNDGAVQRSRVTSLTVTFSAQVTVASLQGAITLSRSGTVLPASQINITPVAGSPNSVRLTFNEATSSPLVEDGSLADGVYVLSIPSMNHTSQLFRLYGDINGDHTVDGSDLTIFGNAFNTANVAFDSNFDGTVDGSDLTQLGNRFGTTL